MIQNLLPSLSNLGTQQSDNALTVEFDHPEKFKYPLRYPLCGCPCSVLIKGEINWHKPPLNAFGCHILPEVLIWGTPWTGAVFAAGIAEAHPITPCNSFWKSAACRLLNSLYVFECCTPLFVSLCFRQAGSCGVRLCCCLQVEFSKRWGFWFVGKSHYQSVQSKALNSWIESDSFTFKIKSPHNQCNKILTQAMTISSLSPSEADF